MPSRGLARTVYLDIENSPHMGYTWGKWQQNVIAVEEYSCLMSVAWAWGDDRKIHSAKLPDFKSAYRNNPRDDSKLMEVIGNVLDEADILVGHNIEKHDVRKSNASFLRHSQLPYSPVKPVDTLREAKRIGLFFGNSLDDLARFLGLGSKLKVLTSGNKFDLWLRCMGGNEQAWTKMERYNKHDVFLNRLVHHRLRAWDSMHPNITLMTGESKLCPVCGHKTVRAQEADGSEAWAYMKSWRAELYVCTRATCGKYAKGRREKLKASVLVA